ncbi:MAG: hypothetical protein ACYCX4_14040 [Bacillota bacterium]
MHPWLIFLGRRTGDGIQDTFAYRIEIADELARLVRTPVDLILLREAPLLLQFLIFKNGKIVFDRDADQRAYYQNASVRQVLRLPKVF